MKKINPLFLVAIIALVLSVPNTFAADLVVEEFGISPAYNTIQGAIDAAADGDRIFIKNRAGDIPWLEDLSIDKSITLLSFVNDTFFIVQGDITISSATNREVRIVGMRNTDGNITGSGSLGDNWSTRIYIMDCFLENGRILTSNTKFYADIVGNTVKNGNINATYANVLGNALYNGTIAISGNATYTGDTVYVVGNKIYNLSSSYGGMNGIFVTCDAFDYEIRNNLVNSTRGVYVSEGNGSQSINIINNTCRTYESTGSGSEYAARGIIIGYTSNNVHSKVELVNNVLDFNETSLDPEYGIELINASDVRVYHNYIDASFDNKILGTPVINLNNDSLNMVSTDAEGVLAGGSNAIDGAVPNEQYYDLNLTPGDAGAYGGSYTLTNFFPIHTGSTRVYIIKSPFVVNSGNNINFKAESYDR